MMSNLRQVNELNLSELGLSVDAYRVVKDISPERIVSLVNRKRTSELFCDEDGLPLYYGHWEKKFFLCQEIERKLEAAGFVKLDRDICSAY